MDDTPDRAGQFPIPARTEKHLARSLEDVSHLFLSQVSGAVSSKGEVRSDPGGEAHSLSADRVTPTVVHPSSDVNHNQLVSLLHENTGILEEGLRAIDANIPWEVGGVVDLVAVDRFNQLAIIDVDTSANDGLLLRGICHLDWFARNASIVRRMYPGHVIEFGPQPRLFLVGPHFSPVFQCVAHRITCQRITCVAYKAVALPNGPGVFFQHA